MTDETSVTISNTGQSKLRSMVERIERLEEDSAAVSADLKEVYAEAKGEGFDTKIMRKLIALRRKRDAAARQEEALLALYACATGTLF